MVGRALAKNVEKYLGKPVIVVNKTGGSGLVGYTEGSTNVKPDGYNVTMLSTDVTMLPHLVNTPISYASFKPVMEVNSDTAAITVRADAPWNTVKEFFDYAKANPGKVKMGHGGVGSIWHIIVASLEKSMGVKFNQVPFESGGATIPALLGGHIDAVPISYAEVKANVDSGKLKTLAILESKAADVIPTSLKTFEKETGVVPPVQGVWRGLAVPKETNGPLSNANTVAEHTMTFVLALDKHIVLHNNQMRTGNFDIKYEYKNMDVQGKTVGLIGAGRIGYFITSMRRKESK